jgi:hypothetical protein
VGADRPHAFLCFPEHPLLGALPWLIEPQLVALCDFLRDAEVLVTGQYNLTAHSRRDGAGFSRLTFAAVDGNFDQTS